jgi:hypothetical protein
MRSTRRAGTRQGFATVRGSDQRCRRPAGMPHRLSEVRVQRGSVTRRRNSCIDAVTSFGRVSIDACRHRSTRRTGPRVCARPSTDPAASGGVWWCSPCGSVGWSILLTVSRTSPQPTPTVAAAAVTPLHFSTSEQGWSTADLSVSGTTTSSANPLPAPGKSVVKPCSNGRNEGTARRAQAHHHRSGGDEREPISSVAATTVTRCWCRTSWASATPAEAEAFKAIGWNSQTSPACGRSS